MTTANKPDPHTLRLVAVESGTHPNTVARYLANQTLQPMTRARIEAALARLGLAQPATSNAEVPSHDLARSA